MTDHEISAESVDGSTPPPAPKPAPIRGAPWWAQVFFALLFLGIGVGITAWLVLGREQRERQPRQAPPRLVEAVAATMQAPRIELTALGQVKPARSVTLTVPVGGLVEAVHAAFQAGSQLPGNAAVVQLDPRDFQLAVATQASEVTLRQSDLALEQGLQQVAQREFDLLASESDVAIRPEDAELVLRKPQLATAQARVAQAETALAQAKLNLERSIVRTPFAGVLTETYVEQGSSVGPNGRLAELVGTETFWVEALWRQDELHWLRRAVAQASLADDPNALHFQVSHPSVWGEGVTRPARFVRVLPQLETEGRLVPVLLAVDQPLATADGQPALLLDSFVRVTVSLGGLEPAVVLPRALLRPNDTVWVAEAGVLRIRPVEVLWRDREQAIITAGIDVGDVIISSYLSSPVDGTLVRLADAAAASDQP
jgi:RND family efflux transporter MFP subunit